MLTSSDRSLGSTAQIRATTKMQTKASARIRLADPDFSAVASAIRSYLRNEFAEELYGYEEIPTRISAYSGKGVGHYATAGDGRADWTPDFKRYLFARTDKAKSFSFSLTVFAQAMRDLEADHPKWYAAVMKCDVQMLPVSHVAAEMSVHKESINRYRKLAIFFLFPYLVANNPNPIKKRVVRVFSKELLGVA